MAALEVALQDNRAAFEDIQATQDELNVTVISGISGLEMDFADAIPRLSELDMELVALQESLDDLGFEVDENHT